MGIGTRERATRAVVDLEISHSLSVIVVRYRHPEPLFGAGFGGHVSSFFIWPACWLFGCWGWGKRGMAVAVWMGTLLLLFLGLMMGFEIQSGAV